MADNNTFIETGPHLLDRYDRIQATWTSRELQPHVIDGLIGHLIELLPPVIMENYGELFYADGSGLVPPEALRIIEDGDTISIDALLHTTITADDLYALGKTIRDHADTAVSAAQDRARVIARLEQGAEALQAQHG